MLLPSQVIMPLNIAIMLYKLTLTLSRDWSMALPDKETSGTEKGVFNKLFVTINVFCMIKFLAFLDLSHYAQL